MLRMDPPAPEVCIIHYVCVVLRSAYCTHTFLLVRRDGLLLDRVLGTTPARGSMLCCIKRVFGRLVEHQNADRCFSLHFKGFKRCHVSVMLLVVSSGGGHGLTW